MFWRMPLARLKGAPRRRPQRRGTLDTCLFLARHFVRVGDNATLLVDLPSRGRADHLITSWDLFLPRVGPASCFCIRDPFQESTDSFPATPIYHSPAHVYSLPRPCSLHLRAYHLDLSLSPHPTPCSPGSQMQASPVVRASGTSSEAPRAGSKQSSRRKWPSQSHDY